MDNPIHKSAAPVLIEPEVGPVLEGAPAHADPNPPRVMVHSAGQAQEICLHNPLGIADKLGRPVLAAFLKCFMGVERILTFEHLMYLNNEASKAPSITDEHSFTRNLMILGFLLQGTMYEVGEALQDLCSAKVAADPTIRSAWAPLDALRAQCHKDDYASTIRNNFSHHLGERDAYELGIEQLVVNNGKDPLVLYETNGGRRHTGRYAAPWDALFSAHNIQDNEIDEFIKRSQQAHNNLPDLVFEFFRAVLDARGIPVLFKEGMRVK
jgi:hypothetical protein